jgi:hypothetical protein
MAFVFDFDVRRTGTADPGAADLADAQRVEQDHEPPEVVGMLGLHSDQRHLVLELPQVRSRSDDRRRDAQHMEPQPFFAAAVPHLDDVSLPNLIERVGELVVLLTLLSADCVQEGVPHLRRELQRLAGLGFLEAVAH